MQYNTHIKYEGKVCMKNKNEGKVLMKYEQCLNRQKTSSNNNE